MNIPFPALANRRSVSAAADKSETPSPAYNRVGRSSRGTAAYGLISKDLLWPKWLIQRSTLFNVNLRFTTIPIIVVFDLPPTRGVYVFPIPAFNVIGDNREMVVELVTKESLQ